MVMVHEYLHLHNRWYNFEISYILLEGTSLTRFYESDYNRQNNKRMMDYAIIDLFLRLS